MEKLDAVGQAREPRHIVFKSAKELPDGHRFLVDVRFYHERDESIDYEFSCDAVQRDGLLFLEVECIVSGSSPDRIVEIAAGDQVIHRGRLVDGSEVGQENGFVRYGLRKVKCPGHSALARISHGSE